MAPKRKTAAKKTARKSISKTAARKTASTPPKEYDRDGNEKPPVYRLDRGESLPGPTAAEKTK